MKPGITRYADVLKSTVIATRLVFIAVFIVGLRCTRSYVIDNSGDTISNGIGECTLVMFLKKVGGCGDKGQGSAVYSISQNYYSKVRLMIPGE